jgi:hypothetical protein
MQLTTLIASAIMAATTINALPGLDARQSPAPVVIGRVDVFPSGGCQPPKAPTAKNFALFGGNVCLTFPSPSKAVNVTALTTNCTRKSRFLCFLLLVYVCELTYGKL